jgi:catabolite regulation protein CreA
LNVLGVVVRFVARARNLSLYLYNSIKVGSGSDPASGSLCARVPFPDSKPAEA